MRISLLQTNIIDRDTEANLKHLSEIFPQNSDLVVLPEMFHCGFLKDMSFVRDEDGNKALEWLKTMAKTHHTTVCGSVAKMENNALYNRFYVVNYDGETQFYDKRHLFSMGNEKEHFSGGENSLIFQVKEFKVKPIICYDLRFPVWCRNVEDYDIMICVANWPAARRDVFTTLLKARAIENQCYAVGVNRVGECEGIRYSGNSMVFDARGKVIAEAQTTEEEIITTEINLEQLKEFREKFPVLKDRDRFIL